MGFIRKRIGEDGRPRSVGCLRLDPSRDPEGGPSAAHAKGRLCLPAPTSQQRLGMALLEPACLQVRQQGDQRDTWTTGL